MHVAISFSDIILPLLAWISLFLVFLAHESGHVLMYRIFFRDKQWHITIGVGRTLIKLKRLTLRAIPISGSYDGEFKNKGSKLQDIMTYLGGPLTNVFFIVLLIILSQILRANGLESELRNLVWVLGFAFWANVYQFFITIVPMEYLYWPYTGNISDGMKILKKAKEKS
jgi:hypothetical protein